MAKKRRDGRPAIQGSHRFQLKRMTGNVVKDRLFSLSRRLSRPWSFDFESASRSGRDSMPTVRLSQIPIAKFRTDEGVALGLLVRLSIEQLAVS